MAEPTIEELQTQVSELTQQLETKSTEFLATTETLTQAQESITALNSQINESQGDSVSVTKLLAQRDAELNLSRAGLEEATGFKASFEKAESELKELRIKSEGYLGRLQTGVGERLEAYGIPEDKRSGRPLETLEAMEEALLIVRAGGGQIVTGSGLGNASSTESSKRTPLEIAGDEIKQMTANVSRSVEISQ